jgi:hypothetical protein
MRLALILFVVALVVIGVRLLRKPPVRRGLEPAREPVEPAGPAVAMAPAGKPAERPATATADKPAPAAKTAPSLTLVEAPAAEPGEAIAAAPEVDALNRECLDKRRLTAASGARPSSLGRPGA